MNDILKKVLLIVIILSQILFFLETFFYQGPIMPQWRFFLGVFSPIITMFFVIYFYSNEKTA